MPTICPQCGKEHATKAELEAMAKNPQKTEPKPKAKTSWKPEPYGEDGKL
jgi:hypothetical protein